MSVDVGAGVVSADGLSCDGSGVSEGRVVGAGVIVGDGVVWGSVFESGGESSVFSGSDESPEDVSPSLSRMPGVASNVSHPYPSKYTSVHA